MFGNLLTLLDKMYIIIHMFINVNKMRVFQNSNKKNFFLKNRLNNTNL